MATLRVFDRLICRCQVAECGHVWIAEGDDVPRRCAACKSTLWNGQRSTPEAAKPLDEVEPPKLETVAPGSNERVLLCLGKHGQPWDTCAAPQCRQSWKERQQRLEAK